MKRHISQSFVLLLALFRLTQSFTYACSFGPGVINAPPSNIGTLCWLRDGATLNVMHGGIVGNSLTASFGSAVNITGGYVGNGFNGFPNSEVYLSGGSVGRQFRNRGEMTVFGGEFALNGQEYSQSTISLADGDIFTGTLADGIAFIFSTSAGDRLIDVTLSSASVPAIDLAPIVVDSESPAAPNGLRAGQILTLREGGVLPEIFQAVGATLNLEGGDTGIELEAYQSTINLLEGSIADFVFALEGSVFNVSGGNPGLVFLAQSGSEVNISGGNLGGAFYANANSEINLLGSQFYTDGVPIELTTDIPTLVESRVGTLSGFLEDGNHFTLSLADIASDANLVLTQVATPAATLTGDYNSDGRVDAADYTVWRDHHGELFALPNRATNDLEPVDQDDYDAWLINYGRTLEDTPATTVPEPSAALLGLAATSVAACFTRHRRSGL